MKPSLCALLLIAGCMQAAPSNPLDDPNLPIIRDYRGPGDACKFVGESAVTVDYLDDSADLVACPTGMDGIAAFIAETGAREVGRYDSWTLFSVSYR